MENNYVQQVQCYFSSRVQQDWDVYVAGQEIALSQKHGCINIVMVLEGMRQEVVNVSVSSTLLVLFSLFMLVLSLSQHLLHSCSFMLFLSSNSLISMSLTIIYKLMDCQIPMFSLNKECLTNKLLMLLLLNTSFSVYHNLLLLILASLCKLISIKILHMLILLFFLYYPQFFYTKLLINSLLTLGIIFQKKVQNYIKLCQNKMIKMKNKIYNKKTIRILYK